MATSNQFAMDGQSADRLARKLAERLPGGGPQTAPLPIPVQPTVLARITGAGASAGYYEAEQVVWNAAGSAWATYTGGSTFTTAAAGEVYELSASAAVPTNAIVQVYPVGDNAGANRWVFAGASAGGGSVSAKITSKSAGLVYLCSLYGNGVGSAATSTGVSVTIINVASAETLPANTYIMVYAVGAGYEGLTAGVLV
jgi:hypothetical protein